MSTYLARDGNWLEVNVLSNDCGLPIESSGLALVLSEPDISFLFYAS
jgi:hypothetical protein